MAHTRYDDLNARIKDLEEEMNDYRIEVAEETVEFPDSLTPFDQRILALQEELNSAYGANDAPTPPGIYNIPHEEQEPRIVYPVRHEYAE